jgi:hypothetical protein
MQLGQGLLSLFLSEMMSVHDWGNGMCDVCVAKYLVEFYPMHLATLYTNSGI